MHRESIYIYGRMHFEVEVHSDSLVHVILPFDANPLVLGREGDVWKLRGRRNTIARDAIIRRWTARVNGRTQ